MFVMVLKAGMWYNIYSILKVKLGDFGRILTRNTIYFRNWMF